MIRTLLEMHIQRYLDDGAPLPAWLARLVRHDWRLRQFVDDFHTLDDALLLSAAARRHTLASESATTLARRRNVAPIRSSTTHRRSAIAWAYCATAAALLLAVVTIAAPRSNRDVAAVQTFAHRLTEMPSDVGHLVTLAADTSQTRLSRYSPATLFAADRAAWRSTANQMIEPLDRPARAVGAWFAKYTDLGARIRSPFEKNRPADDDPPVKSS